MTTREIADRMEVAQVTVRYWLKKYGLKTNHGQCRTVTRTNIICVICERPIPRNQKNLTKCGSCMTAIRRFLTKQKAIELLGGKCKRCGYDKHPAAMEFHHISGKKEFSIGQVANKSWTVIVKELKKCELLCANCHKIEHSKRTKEFMVIAAKNYRGKFIGRQDNLVKSAA